MPMEMNESPILGDLAGGKYSNLLQLINLHIPDENLSTLSKHAQTCAFDLSYTYLPRQIY